MNKLKGYGLREEWCSAICVKMVEEGYLNEERFADSYVRGKLRQNAWGIYKIRAGLREKGISDRLANQVLNELGEAAFDDVLRKLLQKKELTIKGEDQWIKREKLRKYALGKGYEPSRIRQILEEIGF